MILPFAESQILVIRFHRIVLDSLLEQDLLVGYPLGSLDGFSLVRLALPQKASCFHTIPFRVVQNMYITYYSLFSVCLQIFGPSFSVVNRGDRSKQFLVSAGIDDWKVVYRSSCLHQPLQCFCLIPDRLETEINVHTRIRGFTEPMFIPTWYSIGLPWFCSRRAWWMTMEIPEMELSWIVCISFVLNWKSKEILLCSCNTYSTYGSFGIKTDCTYSADRFDEIF